MFARMATFYCFVCFCKKIDFMSFSFAFCIIKLNQCAVSILYRNAIKPKISPCLAVHKTEITNNLPHMSMYNKLFKDLVDNQ